MTIRVLIADDHEVVRSGVRSLIAGGASDVVLVGEADCGESAYRMLLEYRPDLVLLDLSMPGLGGLEALRRIRVREPRVRLVVFSIHESPQIVASAMAAGADGYIGKASSGEALLEAIRAVMAGRRYVSPEIAARLLASTPAHAGGCAQLTARETEILRLYAAGRNAAEIAELLHISAKTVFNTLSGVRQKLGARTTAELVHRASDMGLLTGTRISK